MYSLFNFFYFGDWLFGIIWLMWSFLWALFFALLALKRENLTRFTGWVTMIQAWITCVIPAFLLLAGRWPVGGKDRW